MGLEMKDGLAGGGCESMCVPHIPASANTCMKKVPAWAFSRQKHELCPRIDHAALIGSTYAGNVAVPTHPPQAAKINPSNNATKPHNAPDATPCATLAD